MNNFSLGQYNFFIWPRERQGFGFKLWMCGAHLGRSWVLPSFPWRWWTVLPWQRSGREVKCVLHQLRWSWTHQTLSLRPDTSTSYSLHHVILLKQGFCNGSLQHISFIKVKVLWGNFYLKSRYTFAKAFRVGYSELLCGCKVFQVGLVCCYVVQIEFFACSIWFLRCSELF